MSQAQKPIDSVRLKPVTMWAIKHRGANHKTAMDYYPTRSAAEKDFATIPPGINGWNQGKFCTGCGVGCRDEYEIVEVVVRQMPGPKVRKLKVRSL